MMYEILKVSLKCSVYDRDKLMELIEQSNKLSEIYQGCNERDQELSNQKHPYGKFLSLVKTKRSEEKYQDP